jgi:5-phospho-D-xylono-1,4-lactonase
MNNLIQTVTGKITKDFLGITDSHNHLWIEKNRKCGEKNLLKFRVNNFPLIKKELDKFKFIKIPGISNGNVSILDCQPAGCGRDGNKLLELSLLTGVNIISVTGFHRKEYYAPDSPIWKMDRKSASLFFTEEIKNNLTEARHAKYKDNKIRAGAIKIAFTGALQEQYRILTEAAVDASMETEAPLIVHTEKGTGIEKLISFFEESGIPLSRVMLCHMDKRADIKLHKYLAGKSIYLEYDTFNRPKYKPEKNLWPLLVEMVKEGYSCSIMVGSDLGDNLSWENISKNGGLTGFFKSIAGKLSDCGVEESEIENIIKKNAQNFLCFN